MSNAGTGYGKTAHGNDAQDHPHDTRRPLEKAQRATGAGIAQTVRTGLQLVAASGTYARLRQLRGKVRFARTLADLKAVDNHSRNGYGALPSYKTSSSHAAS